MPHFIEPLPRFKKKLIFVIKFKNIRTTNQIETFILRVPKILFNAKRVQETFLCKNTS